MLVNLLPSPHGNHNNKYNKVSSKLKPCTTNGGLIYYLTNTAAKYYRSLIEFTLTNSCYCDISPVQWQIFQWLLFRNKAYIRTLLYRKFCLNTLNTSVFTSTFIMSEISMRTRFDQIWLIFGDAIVRIT